MLEEAPGILCGDHERALRVYSAACKHVVAARLERGRLQAEHAERGSAQHAPELELVVEQHENGIKKIMIAKWGDSEGWAAAILWGQPIVTEAGSRYYEYLGHLSAPAGIGDLYHPWLYEPVGSKAFYEDVQKVAAQLGATHFEYDDGAHECIIKVGDPDDLDLVHFNPRDLPEPSTLPADLMLHFAQQLSSRRHEQNRELGDSEGACSVDGGSEE